MAEELSLIRGEWNYPGPEVEVIDCDKIEKKKEKSFLEEYEYERCLWLFGRG